MSIVSKKELTELNCQYCDKVISISDNHVCDNKIKNNIYESSDLYKNNKPYYKQMLTKNIKDKIKFVQLHSLIRNKKFNVYNLPFPILSGLISLIHIIRCNPLQGLGGKTNNDIFQKYMIQLFQNNTKFQDMTNLICIKSKIPNKTCSKIIRFICDYHSERLRHFNELEIILKSMKNPTAEFLYMGKNYYNGLPDYNKYGYALFIRPGNKYKRKLYTIEQNPTLVGYIEYIKNKDRSIMLDHKKNKLFCISITKHAMYGLIVPGIYSSSLWFPKTKSFQDSQDGFITHLDSNHKVIKNQLCNISISGIK